MSNKGKSEEEKLHNCLVGKNIRYLRKQKKLTQSDIAKAIQVSFQQVQKYEKGLNGLHSHNLHKIAHRVFNVSMDVLTDPQMIDQAKGLVEETHYEAPEWR
mgnify:FL=1